MVAFLLYTTKYDHIMKYSIILRFDIRIIAHSDIIDNVDTIGI